MQQVQELPALNQAPTLEDIRITREAIHPFIHWTPVLTSQQIDDRVGARVFFKCENFQKIGAFKMRGAASAALRLRESERRKGLCTHSSGNHAQAVARAAKMLEVSAYIVMPRNAPSIKKQATEGYGARIIPCGPTPAEREAMLEKVQRETGAFFIHPYDDYNVIAGQGTAAWEFWETDGPFDSIWPPVGGGGLLAGTALAAKERDPACRVIGAEPALVDDAYRSFQSGRLQTNQRFDTLADGLRTHLGKKNFQIIREKADAIYTVEEGEIVQAMRLIWERMKIIVEPSCAVPLAALLKHRSLFAGQKIGLILTGGNVDLQMLPFG